MNYQSSKVADEKGGFMSLRGETYQDEIARKRRELDSTGTSTDLISTVLYIRKVEVPNRCTGPFTEQLKKKIPNVVINNRVCRGLSHIYLIEVSGHNSSRNLEQLLKKFAADNGLNYSEMSV